MLFYATLNAICHADIDIFPFCALDRVHKVTHVNSATLPAGRQVRHVLIILVNFSAYYQ